MLRSQWAGGQVGSWYLRPHSLQGGRENVCTLGQVSNSVLGQQQSCVHAPQNSRSMQGRRCSDDGFAGRSTFKHNTTGLSGDCICKVQQDEQTTLVTEITWALQEELCCTKASAAPTYPCCIGVKEKKKKMKMVGTMTRAKPRGKISKNHTHRPWLQKNHASLLILFFSSFCAVEQNAATRVRQVVAQSSGTDRQERKWRWRSLIPTVQTNQVTHVTVQVKQSAKVALEPGMETWPP